MDYQAVFTVVVIVFQVVVGFGFILVYSDVLKLTKILKETTYYQTKMAEQMVEMQKQINAKENKK